MLYTIIFCFEFKAKPEKIRCVCVGYPSINTAEFQPLQIHCRLQSRGHGKGIPSSYRRTLLER